MILFLVVHNTILKLFNVFVQNLQYNIDLIISILNYNFHAHGKHSAWKPSYKKKGDKYFLKATMGLRWKSMDSLEILKFVQRSNGTQEEFRIIIFYAVASKSRKGKNRVGDAHVCSALLLFSVTPRNY